MTYDFTCPAQYKKSMAPHTAPYKRLPSSTALEFGANNLLNLCLRSVICAWSMDICWAPVVVIFYTGVMGNHIQKFKNVELYT